MSWFRDSLETVFLVLTVGFGLVSTALVSRVSKTDSKQHITV